MDEIVIHTLDDTAFFPAVKNCETLAKIIDIGDLPIFEADVSGRNDRGGQRRKLGVRRRNPAHFHPYLWIRRRFTEVGEMPPDFLHQFRGRTAYFDCETIKIEAVFHSSI